MADWPTRLLYHGCCQLRASSASRSNPGVSIREINLSIQLLAQFTLLDFVPGMVIIVVVVNIPWPAVSSRWRQIRNHFGHNRSSQEADMNQAGHRRAAGTWQACSRHDAHFRTPGLSAVIQGALSPPSQSWSHSCIIIMGASGIAGRCIRTANTCSYLAQNRPRILASPAAVGPC